MKAPLKILTTTAVAGALVAGGIAGAAPANAADLTATVTPVIAVSTPAVVVPALTASAPIAINTNAGYYTDVTANVAYNGALFTAPVYQDQAGNASVDLISVVSRAAFNYGTVPAGTYTVNFTSTQDDSFTCTPDYATCTTTTYLPAASAPLTFSVTKLKTKIAGFSTKTKKIKHGAYLSKKIDKFTVANAAGAKVILQYKKKGGKWKNIDSVSTSLYLSNAKKLTDGYRYNQALKTGGKSYPRGTQYFRILVKGTAYSSGATSKAFKFVVK